MVVAAVRGYEADCKLHARSNTLGIFVNPGCIVGVGFLCAWLFKSFVVLQNIYIFFFPCTNFSALKVTNISQLPQQFNDLINRNLGCIPGQRTCKFIQLRIKLVFKNSHAPKVRASFDRSFPPLPSVQK